MLFLFPLFFAWHLKNCTPDSKEMFSFFLWERQEPTEIQDSAVHDSECEFVRSLGHAHDAPT